MTPTICVFLNNTSQSQDDTSFQLSSSNYSLSSTALENVQAQLSTMYSLDIVNVFVVTLSNLEMVHVIYLGQHVLTTATKLP